MPMLPKAKLGPPAEAGSQNNEGSSTTRGAPRMKKKVWFQEKPGILGFGDGEHVLKDGIYDMIIYIYIVYIILV